MPSGTGTHYTMRQGSSGRTHILLPEPRLEPPKLELKLELNPEPELDEGMADLADEKLLPPMRPPLRAAKAGLAELSICIAIQGEQAAASQITVSSLLHYFQQ